ncbi:MAG: protein kinase [Pyrinomonadaceae bacterium]
MADESWQKVREIFDSALLRKPDERRKFIGEACGGNKTLLAEVESLLSSLDSAESFMETPAVAEVADAIGDNGNKLEQGHSLGHYKIIKELGTGGMGEVYLAKDEKLDRRVAIKVLNEKFSDDESNLSRFIREAKAASALNHPNILVIHKIGEADGVNYIVSEYVEGETLRTICKEKTLKLSEVLDISIQIAGALATAHKAHLIHRDIKPENIMLRPDGYAKILDFGLAKLIEEKNRSFLGLEESTAKPNPTAKGVIMGTVNYMSPEQAKGEDVDERTDIFSFGVMIYEMIAGTTPFAGDSMSETFANLINAEPQPLSRFSPNIPDELQRVVAKMLRKKKDDRYQTMKGLLTDLKDLRDNLTSDERLERTAPAEGENPTIALQATTAEAKQQTVDTQKTTSHSAGMRGKVVYGAAVFGVLLLASFGFFGYRYLNPQRLVNTAFRNTTIEKLPISGKFHSIAISPDGKYLAYVKGELGAKMHLILRHQATGSEQEIQVTENSYLTLDSFSSDGNYFYFVSFGNEGIGTLFRVPILGGEPKKLIGDMNSFGSFFPNGKEFVFLRAVLEPSPRDRLVSYNIESGEERVVHEFEDANNSDPYVSPDGEKIAFFILVREGFLYQLAWIRKEGGERKVIGDEKWSVVGSQVRWLKDSSGLVVQGRSEDEENPKLSLVDFPSGETADLSNDVNYYKQFALSSNSQTLAAIRTRVTKGIWAFDSETKNARQIKANAAERYTGPGVTPDNRVIYTKPDGKGNDDLWSINSDGTNDHLLLSLSKPIWLWFKPVWDDGIYFSINQKLWKVGFDGKNPHQLFEDADSRERLIGVTPDTKTLLFTQNTKNSIVETLNKLDMDTGEISPLINDKNVNVFYGAMSPDGKKVIYEYNLFPSTNAKTKLVLVDFDGSKISNPKIIPEFPPFEAIKFTDDSKNLYFLKLENRADLWQWDLSNGQISKITDFNLEMIYNFNMSADGKKIYLMRGNTTDEIVLIRNVE